MIAAANQYASSSAKMPTILDRALADAYRTILGPSPDRPTFLTKTHFDFMKAAGYDMRNFAVYRLIPKDIP